MNREQFLQAFKEALQRDEDLTLDMELKNIDEWDSLAKMEVISHFDEKYGLNISYSDFENVETLEDIAKKICN